MAKNFRILEERLKARMGPEKWAEHEAKILALGRDYRLTVIERIQRDREFAIELLEGATASLRDGDVALAWLTLRDLVDGLRDQAKMQAEALRMTIPPELLPLLREALPDGSEIFVHDWAYEDEDHNIAVLIPDEADVNQVESTALDVIMDYDELHGTHTVCMVWHQRDKTVASVRDEERIDG